MQIGSSIPCGPGEEMYLLYDRSDTSAPPRVACLVTAFATFPVNVPTDLWSDVTLGRKTETFTLENGAPRTVGSIYRDHNLAPEDWTVSRPEVELLQPSQVSNCPVRATHYAYERFRDRTLEARAEDQLVHPPTIVGVPLIYRGQTKTAYFVPASTSEIITHAAGRQLLLGLPKVTIKGKPYRKVGVAACLTEQVFRRRFAQFELARLIAERPHGAEAAEFRVLWVSGNEDPVSFDESDSPEP